MKNALIVILVIAVLGIAGYFIYKSSYKSPSSTSNTSTQTPAATNEVKISNFSFQPQEITVKVGTEVIWTNSDSTTHTVSGTGFDSGNISPSNSFKHTFSVAGTFDYHCSIHTTMTGKVIVQ